MYIASCSEASFMILTRIPTEEYKCCTWLQWNILVVFTLNHIETRTRDFDQYFNYQNSINKSHKCSVAKPDASFAILQVFHDVKFDSQLAPSGLHASNSRTVVHHPEDRNDDVIHCFSRSIISNNKTLFWHHQIWEGYPVNGSKVIVNSWML